MQNLQVIEVKGLRVLTTKQLAEAYETEPERIKLNYRYNKDHYVIGKHIIPIEGEELKAFKARYQFDTQLKYAKSLYLWTEKGALLHAKSLNTDKAWQVYDYLVDFYFRVKEEQNQQVTAPKGKQVVDIPVNGGEQALIAELQKDISGLSALMNVYNCYQSEEDYEKIAYTVRQMGNRVACTALSVAMFKPGIIEKVF